MTAATPDATSDTHVITLDLLPPEAFPDVATVRRFFASPLYRALLTGARAVLHSEHAIPDPLYGDAVTGAAFLLDDLAVLGGALSLPHTTPLSIKRETEEEGYTEEDFGRWLRGLVAAMALDLWQPERTSLVGALAAHVTASRGRRDPIDFGDQEGPGRAA